MSYVAAHHQLAAAPEGPGSRGTGSARRAEAARGWAQQASARSSVCHADRDATDAALCHRDSCCWNPSGPTALDEAATGPRRGQPLGHLGGAAARQPTKAPTEPAADGQKPRAQQRGDRLRRHQRAVRRHRRSLQALLYHILSSGLLYHILSSGLFKLWYQVPSCPGKDSADGALH
eukprot:SAG31_NODE_1866_length_7025_cov_2.554017_6_plen_176_part_00